MLRASLASRDINAHQRASIANEIGFIGKHPERASEPMTRDETHTKTSASRHMTYGEGGTVGQHSAKVSELSSQAEAGADPRPAYRYVTRDEDGIYLGILTINEAKAIWPTSDWLGPVINVPERIAAGELESLLNRGHRKPDVAASERLLRSMRQAVKFERSTLDRRADPRDSLGTPHLKNVLHRSKKPVCTVPIDMVNAVFGKGWFLVDESTVQLATTFDDDKIKQMGASARRRFESSLPSPRAETRDSAIVADNNTDGGKVISSGHAPATSLRQSTPMVKEPDDRPYVTRDARGLYLGIHRPGWAPSHRYVPYVEQGVIVLPEALPTRKAAILAGKADKNTLKAFNASFRKVIKRSESYIESVQRVTADEFWSKQDERFVRVYTLNASSPASLTPPQLRELFGNGWFLVSRTEAQLMVPVDNGVIERMQRMESEARAIIDAKAAEARKAWEDTLRATTDVEQRSTDDSRAHHSQSEESRESTIPPFMRLMMSLGIGEAHARTIYGQVMLVVQHGYRSQLIGTLREAFPVDPIALPGGRELDAYRIAGALARQNGQSLTHEERDYVLLEIDEAMSEGERRAEEERHEQEKQLERAERHKHAVTEWVESVELDPNSDVVSRELAEVFEQRQGVVLVMQDGDLYRNVLNTSMDEGSYVSIDQFLPFTHFIVRVPKIEGVYGFGVVRGSRGSGVDLIAIPDGRSEVGDVDALLPFFWRVLFFICANRNSAGGGTEYYDQARSRARSAPVARAQGDRKPSRGKRVSENAVMLGKTFDIGMRVVFLSEGPGFRNASSSSLDIRPHAVAGTTYVNSNGTEVVRRPYWNHGAGKKRNALPPEIVERNIRYRSDSRE